MSPARSSGCRSARSRNWNGGGAHPPPFPDIKRNTTPTDARQKWNAPKSILSMRLLPLTLRLTSQRCLQSGWPGWALTPAYHVRALDALS
jgi:hypothetical protein